ncbi:hypothetical protein D3C79_774960 [compost metagenome]
MKTVSGQLYLDLAVRQDVYGCKVLNVPTLTASVTGRLDFPNVAFTVLAVAKRGEVFRQQEQTVVSTAVAWTEAPISS